MCSTALANLGGMLFSPDMLVIGLTALVATLFWVWTLVGCFRNYSLTDNERIIWVLIILFAHFIGAILYLVIAPANRRPSSSR